MSKSFCTLILIPNGSPRCHKLKLPGGALYFLAAIAVFSSLMLVAMGFSYAKMAFQAADYNNLQAENHSLKVQKKNLEFATLRLGEKITNLENTSRKIQTIIEKDSATNRGKPNTPAVGGSKLDYTNAELLWSGNLKEGIDLLKDRTAEMESQFMSLEQVAIQRAMRLQFTPNLWPVRGAITSSFGVRADPFNGEAEVHRGVDIAALYNSQIQASADGRVLVAEFKAGYGNLVVLDHGNGVTTRYGHMARLLVRLGQRVKKGDIIGLVGTTGRSTAPHLHYEVRMYDRPVNPSGYLPRG